MFLYGSAIVLSKTLSQVWNKTVPVLVKGSLLTSWCVGGGLVLTHSSQSENTE